MSTAQYKWVMKQNVVCGIYRILHVPSGRAYIGQSYDIYARWSGHIRDLRTGRHHTASFQEQFTQDSAINDSLAIENLTFSIVQVCDKHIEKCDLTLFEQAWWDYENLTGNPFNGRPRNGGFASMTTETKDRISKKTKGRTFSEESKKKMSLAKKGKPGPSPSEETKEKISKSRTGQARSPSTRKKISESMRKIREDAILRMAENEALHLALVVASFQKER